MKLVVGLGNPGPKYQQTRHNVGFEVLRELSGRHSGGKPQVAHEAEIVEVFVGGQKLLLAAPQTYMNLSGRSVRKIVDYFDIDLQDLLIVVDDLNLELARLRLRPQGSAGGQKGLRDLIQRLGTEEFSRLRIGIGTPPGRMDAADFVLSRFRKEEQEEIQQGILRAADAVEVWAGDGLEAAMNRFNVT